MTELQSRFTAFLAVSVVVGLLLAGCAELPASPQLITPPPATVAPTASPADSADVSKAKSDLAKRTGAAVADIKTRSVEAVNWPDASLGCPQPDMMYAQVVTPGQRIVLETGGQTYEYHSGGANVVFCPPQKK